MESAHPLPDTALDTDLRGRLFTDLDRLAFALEMEAAEHLEHGRAGESLRAEERRLGVRLAQRLVSGVPADEVDRRMWAWGEAYDRRLGGAGGGEGAERPEITDDGGGEWRDGACW